MKQFSIFIFIALWLTPSAFAATAANANADQHVEKTMDHLFGEHQPYKHFFFALKDAVLHNQRQYVSELMEYPISIYGEDHKYVIQDKAEFLELYDAIFSEHMLTVLRQQEFKDLFAKWSGVMIGQGEIWFHGTCPDPDCQRVKIEVKSLYNPSFFTSAQGKRAFNTFMEKEKSKLHHSLSRFFEPVLLWHTKNFIIRIDRIGTDNYRYAAWNIGSDQSKKPNIILKKGQLFRDGSGGNHHYEFKKGRYTYTCSVNLLGAADTPPGSIEVFENRKRILYEPVIKAFN